MRLRETTTGQNTRKPGLLPGQLGKTSRDAYASKTANIEMASITKPLEQKAHLCQKLCESRKINKHTLNKSNKLLFQNWVCSSSVKRFTPP